MRHTTLSDWLAWQETLHPNPIDLGLERVRAVAAELGLLNPPCPVITVAGTNGKGSAVAMYEAVLHRAGLMTGAYTSPHLRCYNERIRIAGEPAPDAAICESFARIDAARGETTLTYFEFGTLAALDLFTRAGVGAMVLEVGLGGRLDAVNIIDADLAHFGSIGIDHAEWLGPDRESIGREKAGILRSDIPAVCADRDPPESLLAAARGRSVNLQILGRDFDWQTAGERLLWEGAGPEIELPAPALTQRFQRDNAATVVAGLTTLDLAPGVSARAITEGLAAMRIEGRFQRLGGPVPTIVDVAHNPNAAGALAGALAETRAPGRTLAALAMLADKDVEGVAAVLDDQVDLWYAASVGGSRGLAAAALAQRLVNAGVTRCTVVEGDIVAAWKWAAAEVRPGDRVVVFGSFYAVGEFLSWWHARA